MPAKDEFREPHLDTPAQVQEEADYEPVSLTEPPPQGIVETIKRGRQPGQRRVQRLIRPVKKTHKEVIINAETLETRVAVLEEGKLEEFTIERTTEERLVGSIFKGRVRNLEDGLKAAFVDIGFEKNAFLHYWDIVPNNFDSGVEIVERESRRREKPQASRKRTFRASTPQAATSSSRSPKGPLAQKARASRPTSCCPDVTWSCCPTPTRAASPARSKTSRSGSASRRSCAKLYDPRGHGRDHPHRR